jgi:hypothetical protein
MGSELFHDLRLMYMVMTGHLPIQQVGVDAAVADAVRVQDVTISSNHTVEYRD